MKPSLRLYLFKTTSVMRRCITFRAANAIRIGRLPTRILEQLHSRDGIASDTLAAACELNHTQLQLALDKLQNQRLSERRDSAGAERIFLTPEGRPTAGWGDFILDEMDELLTVGLSEQEKQRLMELLSHVYENLRSEPLYHKNPS